MKVKIFLFLFAIFMFAFVSCEGINETGGFALVLNIQNKTIVSDAKTEVTDIAIGLSGPNGERINNKYELINNPVVSINNLDVGEWQIHVDGYNSDDILVADWDGVAHIYSESKTVISVVLQFIEGDGNLNIDISWPTGSLDANNHYFQGTLLLQEPQAEIMPIDFNSENNSVSSSMVLKSGYYELSLSLYHDSDPGVPVWGTSQAVLVLANQTSNANFVMESSNGNIVFELDIDLATPVILTLVGARDRLAVNKNLTVFVDSDETGLAYRWYIDGIRLDQEVSDRLILGPGELELGLGNYQIDVIAQKDNRYGSTGFSLDVVEANDPDISDEYIIADHNVVDEYGNIPQQYIDIVKTMLVDIAGESHSAAYREGMAIFALTESNYGAVAFDGSFPAPAVDELRIGRHGSTGEEDFFTNRAAIENLKTRIASQEAASNPIDVLGFGWCWDMTWHNNPTAERDPVYNVGWGGSSVDGPEGDLPWGLDAGDMAITGNSVCMDTYLSAVDEYNQYAQDNGYSCLTIFTTGPVDGNNGNERGFQREIKNQYIRDYVIQNGGGRVLFDYADILYYNDAGEYQTFNWNDGGTLRTHPGIHPDNDTEDVGHISYAGAERLAKAMWWLLARIAGWDGK